MYAVSQTKNTIYFHPIINLDKVAFIEVEYPDQSKTNNYTILFHFLDERKHIIFWNFHNDSNGSFEFEKEWKRLQNILTQK